MEIPAIEKNAVVRAPQAGFQEQFASSSVDVVFGGGILASGKMTLLDSHVVTPFGLRVLRDIKVGDIISNPDTGGQERVIQLHPIETVPFMRVSFSDGTHVDCSTGHLWKVRVAGKKSKRKIADGAEGDWRIWNAQMMHEFMQAKESGRHRSWGLSIPICAPVQFTRPITPITPRPIQPYVLGVLLGDGCMSESAINDCYCVILSTPDEFISERIAGYGYDMSHFSTKKGTECLSYRMYDKRLLDGLRVLGLAGHKAETKFIPETYKYSTIAERKELLCGLIDTDGYISASGAMSYTTVSHQLAEDVAFVVRSIGGRASVTIKPSGYKDACGDVHECQDAYTVSIDTRDDSEIVSLPKKKTRTRCCGYGNGKQYFFEKRVVSVEYIGEREGRCITVDNPSGLYMTDDFTVTHNSYGLVLALAEPLMTDPDFRALISRRSLGSVKSGGGFVDKFREIFGEYCEIRQADSPRVSFDCGAYCDLTYIDDSNIEKMRERVKGWEYDVIAIDELTEMSWEAFSYIQTRNRGRSKTFTGKFFATMNPKKSHWVRTFIDWYINPQGYIDPERDGKVRYFYIAGSSVKEVIWGNSKLEVYQKCKASIDRKMASVGGNFTYENFIKSFVFYQGHLAENKGLIGDNPDYVGSVSASGGAMSEALLEGNWNVDPDNEEERAIPMPSARLVFTEDPAVNGDLWVTVDLADYGTDNVVALAWNGFHIIGIMMLGHTRPAENANAVQSFALKYGVGRSHIIYDATAARYFNDYIPEAVPYLSSSKSRGMYKYDAMTLKDNCYLRLCKMIRSGCITMDDAVANSTYTHENLKHKITVEQEFMQECAVVHFNEFVSGKKRLDTKREMNRRLGNGRSMDLLDPCAMRMLPCCDLEYGAELEDGYETTFRTKNLAPVQESVFDETVWY